MSEQAQQDDLNRAFEEFLRTRRDHRDGLSARQQLWTAFEAGGQYVLKQLKIGSDATKRDPGEALDGGQLG